MNSHNRNCLPSFEKVNECMEKSEEYRAYMHENTFKNSNAKPQDKFLNKNSEYQSYDNTFNLYNPKVQLSEFYKCSSSLFEECLSNNKN